MAPTCMILGNSVLLPCTHISCVMEGGIINFKCQLDWAMGAQIFG